MADFGTSGKLEFIFKAGHGVCTLHLEPVHGPLDLDGGGRPEVHAQRLIHFGMGRAGHDLALVMALLKAQGLCLLLAQGDSVRPAQQRIMQ